MSSVSTAPEFDLGPLTWVKSEIDLALERAALALKQFGANPQDSTQIKFCRTHLHQVRGALAIVGLDGVTQFADALESLLADIEEGRQAADGSRIALLGSAVEAARQYLDDLVAGEPNQPLRLLPTYAQLTVARGLPPPAGSELFFPDLALRPALRPMAPRAAGAGAEKLRGARARFQKGLLAWLKAPSEPHGAQELQLAAVEISGADDAPVLRAFWWAVSGLFAAVAERKVADETQVKHLLPRIDQQIRRQFEGSRTVPERLMRDVLYNVAVCHSNRGVVKEIRRTYGLDQLIPSAPAADAQGTDLQPIVKRLREIATGAEDAWSKFCGGTAQALVPFREAAASLHQGSARLAHTDFRRLTQALAATAAWIAEQPGRHSESLSIEMATAILVIANALDNFAHLGADFVHQVDVMVARLHACIAGTPLPADAELPALDEMSRRAQERLLIAQVVREIQSNLGQVEQALDTFFRDTSQRDALAGLTGPLHQIEGALTILGQDAAGRALRASGEQIGRFAAADYIASNSDFEAVANQLSALGFFVESLQSGGGDYDEFLRRLEAGPGPRHLTKDEQFSATEEAPKGMPAPPPVPTPPAPEPVVIEPIAPAESELPLEPDFETTIVLEALPVPSAEPVAEQPFEAMLEPMFEAETPVAVLAPASAPVAAPAPQVQASTEEIDAELLEIFLEEAAEVLSTIAENLESLRNRPADAEALTVVRRAFHTLKGSSRMVGLKDFGEVAWAVEQVHNQWLRQELKVSAELLNLVALSHETFSAWVTHLASGEGVVPDATRLVAMAERLRGIEAAPTPVTAAPEPEFRPEAPIEDETAPIAPEFEFTDEAAPSEAASDLVAEPLLVLETAPAEATPQPLDETSPAAPEIEFIDEAAPSEAAPDLVAEPVQALATEPAEVEPETVSFADITLGETAGAGETIGTEIAVEPIQAPELGQTEPAETPPLSIAFADIALVDTVAAEATVDSEAPSEPPVFEVPIELAEISSEPSLEDLVPSIDLDLTEPAPETPELPPEPIAAAAAGEIAAEEPAPLAEADTVAPRQIITVSPALHEIFLEEAGTHLASLHQHFGDLEMDPAAPTSIDMVRAAHTLGSIAGTVGFPTIKRLGHALEDALLRRSNSSRPESLEALESLRLTIAELDQMIAALIANEAPSDNTGLVDTLAGLYPLASVAAAGDAAPEAGLLAAVAATTSEALPDDRLDESLLPIFLEEASDLVAGISERLDMWRENPADTDSINALARLLHTLKGSARMAGALRVGDLTHRLESRVEHTHKAGDADTARVSELQSAFDDIALLIQELRGAPGTPAAVAAPVTDVADQTTAQIIDFSAFAPSAVPAPMPEMAPVAAPPEVMPEDHLDEQLLPIFLEEATELSQAVYAQLDALRANPADEQAAHGLARSLHTIKGSARMAGAMSLGFLTHTLETRIEEAALTGAPNLALIDEIRGTFDAIANVIEALRHGEALAAITVEAPPTATEEAASEVADAMPAIPAEVTTPAAEPPAPAPAPAPTPATEVGAKPREEAAPKPMLRVRAELIDHLVNDAGELSIARARIEGEMRNLKQSLLELTENVIRLRRQLREVEIQAETQMQSKIALASEATTQFDPLELDRFTRFQELTRMMAESVNDVATVQQNLLKNLDEANAGLIAQSRLNRELQQRLMAVRMVPFASITERLYRIVRQTAKELGKRTDLEIKGGQIELDQNVINTMIGPFEHLLRNAIAHGIEAPEARRAAGKDEMGEIVLSLRQEGNEVVITMADDGGGLHYDRIRAKAVANGLLGADEPADDRRLAEMIFHSGFSTATEVTQVSGRGVGMDVVKTDVASLGGRIDVTSEAGRGSVFRIYLPLTLAVTNAVPVRVGSRTFAIPASMIDQVQELKEAHLARIRDAGQIEWQGNVYPFHFLPHLLGEPDALPEARKLFWIMLLHSGTQRIAIQVDELKRSQEIVVKNIGPQLSRVVGVAGATVLGDGRVVLILNPVALAARLPAAAATGVVQVAVATPAPVRDEQAATLPTVFVVDDSLTVRKITGRLLAREGYQVVTAKDGVDALEQLTELTPDVIISDIEMPRMDGFELARNIRSDARLQDIPIIMITSRTAEKHRSHASEIGVNNYLGKPYQEEDLLGLVAGYVAEHRKRH